MPNRITANPYPPHHGHFTPSHFQAESKHVFADPAVDESSILEPLPTAIENDSSFAATFQIPEDFTTKGRLKLIDKRGYCYNIKGRRANATNWQCTVRPKVTIIKLS